MTAVPSHISRSLRLLYRVRRRHVAPRVRIISVCTGVYYEPLTPNVGPEPTRSTDGGKTWASKPIATVLTSIGCAGPTFCELAGPNGKLAMSIATSLFVQVSPTTRDLHAVACPQMGACYAVGAVGTIVARRT